MRKWRKWGLDNIRKVSRHIVPDTDIESHPPTSALEYSSPTSTTTRRVNTTLNDNEEMEEVRIRQYLESVTAHSAGQGHWVPLTHLSANTTNKDEHTNNGQRAASSRWQCCKGEMQSQGMQVNHTTSTSKMRWLQIANQSSRGSGCRTVQYHKNYDLKRECTTKQKRLGEKFQKPV